MNDNGRPGGLGRAGGGKHGSDRGAGPYLQNLRLGSVICGVFRCHGGNVLVLRGESEPRLPRVILWCRKELLLSS